MPGQQNKMLSHWIDIVFLWNAYNSKPSQSEQLYSFLNVNIGVLGYCTAKRTGVSHKELEIPALAFGVYETLDILSWNQGIVLFISGYTYLLVGLGYKWSLNGNTAINSNSWEPHKSWPTVWVESGSHRHWFNSEGALIWL